MILRKSAASSSACENRVHTVSVARNLPASRFASNHRGSFSAISNETASPTAEGNGFGAVPQLFTPHLFTPQLKAGFGKQAPFAVAGNTEAEMMENFHLLIRIGPVPTAVVTSAIHSLRWLLM